MSDTTTALAPVAASKPVAPRMFSLMPSNLAEAMKFAELMSRSDLVPKDYKGKPENCFIAVQMGMELGLSPMAAIQSISVIGQRPALFGDAVLAVVRGSGELEAIRESVDGTGDMLVATCAVKRRGEEATARTFSVDDAKKAKLWGKEGPWTQYPKRMLQMRARSFALRDVFPDILRGINVAEEAGDIVETTVTVAPSEPQRVALPEASQTATPAEHAQQAQAQTGAPAVPSTQPAAMLFRGYVAEAEPVEPNVWAVKVAGAESGELLEFLTKSEELFKQAQTTVGAEAVIAVHYKMARRADQTECRVLLGLAADEA